jgi:hypothetical protein
VLLYYDDCGVRHVGYIANMHTQAFQGSEAVLLSQLTDAMIFISLFKEQTAQRRDVIDFDIVCGDFNADNMSPGKEVLLVEQLSIHLYEKTALLMNFYVHSTILTNSYFVCFLTCGCNVVVFFKDINECVS